MRFAIVENGEVVNIAESNHPLTAEWVQVDYGAPVSIGDAYDGRAFYDSDGNIRMNYIQRVTQDQVTELETAFDALMGGVSVALGL